MKFYPNESRKNSWIIDDATKFGGEILLEYPNNNIEKKVALLALKYIIHSWR